MWRYVSTEKAQQRMFFLCVLCGENILIFMKKQENT